jgi:hypothetical protein
LPPYPARGDREGWERWWAAYREAFRAAGASADGIFDESASLSCGSTDLANLLPPVSPADRARRARRRRWRRRVRAEVRRVLAAELPAALAAIRDIERGEKT